jgi:hypothetical protein
MQLASIESLRKLKCSGMGASGSAWHNNLLLTTALGDEKLAE